MENIKVSLEKINNFHFDIDKMENSPLVQQARLKEAQNANKKIIGAIKKTGEIARNKDFINIIPDILPEGFQPVCKEEFHRVAKQLTAWGIRNSGAVIKREGPTFVQMAVDITIQNLSWIKSPRTYFRAVLKNLQNRFVGECC